MTAIVTCHRVTRTFRTGRVDYQAVTEVDCEVMRGDAIALVGPSGSGKSTLLHLMAGLDTPTSGEVNWPGLADEGLRSQIAVVFQAPSLVPDLTVLENVQLPLIISGQTAGSCQDQALSSLASLKLLDLAPRLPDELSGGQSQRVSVARSVAVRPRLLLADEPTGQLDHDTAGDVLDALLLATVLTGAALVVATHDAAIAARLRSRWQIRDGVIRAASSVGSGL
jgi:putative ABC transport system ATP-binding protein